MPGPLVPMLGSDVFLLAIRLLFLQPLDPGRVCSSLHVLQARSRDCLFWDLLWRDLGEGGRMFHGRLPAPRNGVACTILSSHGRSHERLAALGSYLYGPATAGRGEQTCTKRPKGFG